MNKYVVLGIFFAIFIVGLGVIFNNESVSFNDFMRSLSDLNPRAMSILALPLVAVLFALGVYLHKRSVDRMWKDALKDTRAKKLRQRRQ